MLRIWSRVPRSSTVSEIGKAGGAVSGVEMVALDCAFGQAPISRGLKSYLASRTSPWVAVGLRRRKAGKISPQPLFFLAAGWIFACGRRSKLRRGESGGKPAHSTLGLGGFGVGVVGEFWEVAVGDAF